MKRTLILLTFTAILASFVSANPTGRMTYFATSGDTLYVLREGADNPIASFDLPSGTEGLTFDGENWWMIKQPEETIYCFDYGGDYVTSFPAPAPNPVGLAWDAGYLWVSCSIGRGDVRVYQTTMDGSPGPYPDFEAKGFTGLTVFQDYVLTFWEEPNMLVDFYTKNGDFIKTLELEPSTGGYGYGATYSITNDGAYLWAVVFPHMTDFPDVEKFDPDTGEGLGSYLPSIEYTGLTAGFWSYTNIGIGSFGRIKAFFK